MSKKRESNEDYIFIVGMAVVMLITGIVLTFVASWDWAGGSRNSPPSIGYCTLDGSHISCIKDMGGEPHHYSHRNFTVIEDTER